MDSTGFFVLAGLIIVLVIASLILGFWGLGRMFGRSSRFDDLAKYYTVSPRRNSIEKSQLWHTIKIGRVQWRKWASLAVGVDGFYIGIKYGFKEHAFLIPWTALHKARETRLYWRPAVELEVGDPVIVRLIVYMEVFRMMESYLENQSGLSFVDHGSHT